MPFDLAAHVEAIFRYCRARCFSSGEAEDLAQDILLVAWQCRDRLAQAKNPGAYLGGICRNLYASHVRKRLQAIPTASLDLDIAHGLPLPSAHEADEELALLYARVADLAHAHRTLLIAHYFQGKSIRTIALETGIPEGTIKWRLKTARDLLKKEWHEMEPLHTASPTQIKLRLSGSAPALNPVAQLTTPTRCALLWALQSPLFAREAAVQAGISTVLAEAELEGLSQYEAVFQQASGSWATSFFIETAAYQDKVQALARRYAPALREALLRQAETMRGDLMAIGFSTGARTLDESMPTLLLHLLHDGMDFSDYDPPRRPDGGRYYFDARQATCQGDPPQIKDWYDCIPGLSYGSCVVGPLFVMERIGLDGRKVLAVCKQLIETGALAGVEEECVATLLAGGVLHREGEAFRLAVPLFTARQHKAFRALAAGPGECFAQAARPFRDEVQALLTAEMPAHLRDQRPYHVRGALLRLLATAMREGWPTENRAAEGLLLWTWDEDTWAQYNRK